jgi:hypothetical protein
LGLLAYLAAPIPQELLFGTHILIMLAALFLAVGWGLLWAAIAQRWHWAQLGMGLIGVGLAAWLVRGNFAPIQALTHDATGRQIIEGMKAVADPQTPTVELWGPRYFALGYARWASRELPELQLVMPGLDLSGLPADIPRFYTTQDAFYIVPLTAWEARLGRLYPSSAAYRIVELSTTPRTHPPRLAANWRARQVVETRIPMGEAVTLLGYLAGLDAEGALRLTLLWQAERAPEENYSVFVHVTDKAQVAGPDDIIANGDRRHPVYGLYPTSRWTPGEIVRDDYRVPLPAGRSARLVSFGLYTQDAQSGAFHNVGKVDVLLQP